MNTTIKLFEVRDSCTCIPVLAIDMNVSAAQDESEEFLLRMAGYGLSCLPLLTNLNTNRSCYDPFQWLDSSRTLKVAHDYILKNWDSLKSGEVIDVEFIMGETKEKKITDRLWEPPQR